MRNDKAFHAPLNPLDSETHTFGCRHTNPDICAKNELPQVCAFARTDKMCFAPPQTWPKQFQKLKAVKGKTK
jgi:hypothetical protein